MDDTCPSEQLTSRIRISNKIAKTKELEETVLKKETIPAFLVVAMLSACGGSSGGGANPGGDGTPTPVEPDTGPASASSSDLLDYVLDGGSQVYNYHSNRNNITRMQRSTTVDGEQVVVTVDQLAGGSNGLIQYRNGDDLTIYKLDDTLVASTNTPDGQYNGAFDVNYSVDGGTTWEVGTGDAGATINTSTGEANFGGMATSNREDGSFSSIEYYSTSDLVDGQFVDNAASVVHREDGGTQGLYEGTLNGMVLDDGIVGIVGGNNRDFQASGGFTLSPNSGR
ncbi:hypothetical protein [Salipiger thiooxidans]|uniref:hypothetical protein n=1 Tax=Salipiger thiooxidans TaxID=282683 RepID=UPI001CFB5587|nr:hypothetical protein [Salipiger thiooxidans]